MLSWSRRVLARLSTYVRSKWGIGMLLLVVVLIGAHLQRELTVADKVGKLGGRAEWTYGCVTAVYDFGSLDDRNFSELAKALRQLSCLKSLSISGTAVTDDGLAPIEQLSSLRWLYLGRTRITDTGLLHLQKLKNLEYLDISELAISEEALSKLKNRLPQLGKIRRDSARRRP